MISFSTSSYTVTVTPFSILTSLPSLSRWDSARTLPVSLSTICFTRLPSLSLRATLVVTLTVSKLSFSFTCQSDQSINDLLYFLSLSFGGNDLAVVDHCSYLISLIMPFSVQMFCRVFCTLP